MSPELWLCLYLYASGVILIGCSSPWYAAVFFPLWPLAVVWLVAAWLWEQLPSFRWRSLWRVENPEILRVWGWTRPDGYILGIFRLGRVGPRSMKEMDSYWTREPRWDFRGLSYKAYCFGRLLPLSAEGQSQTGGERENDAEKEKRRTNEVFDALRKGDVIIWEGGTKYCLTKKVQNGWCGSALPGGEVAEGVTGLFIPDDFEGEQPLAKLWVLPAPEVQ